MSLDPWLSTERVRLRRPDHTDLGQVFAVHSDPATYRHLPEAVMRTPEQAEQLLDAWVAHWDAYGFGYATVLRRSDGAILGFAGAKHQRLSGRPILHLYYRFDPAVWGQGYATEATTAILRRVGADLPELPVVARVATNNPGSVTGAQRVGLLLQDEQDPHDSVEHQLYASARLAHSMG